VKLAASVQALLGRYEGLSLRERALLATAALGLLLILWDTLLAKPLALKERSMRGELETYLSVGSQSEAAAGVEAAAARLQSSLFREQAVSQELARVDAELDAAGAGLIEPDRMVEVVREVLARQRGLTLVSLRNQPVRSLLPAANEEAVTGPFVHPVELVVTGEYLSILAYLRELETLPWRLQWEAISLESESYPVSRVRIELSTLGMERAWLGV